jgi:sigma-B regulation protein RsbU (phosphoserine phosphatase)
MPGSSRVLLYDTTAGTAGALADTLRRRGIETVAIAWERADAVQATEGDVAVVWVDPRGDNKNRARVAGLLEELAAASIATVVRGATNGLHRDPRALIEWLDPDVSLDELVGRVSGLARYAPLVGQMQRELDHLHRLGEQLHKHFAEVDQEMRLASRLQRDFLPREFPTAPPLRFAALYRPATWVSGDMYDVFRVDDRHIGLFMSDAMGHGVAAGLLTMFLRQALVGRATSADGTRPLDPVEALERLRDCLLRQKLPHSQFVTAVYGLVDVQTHEVRLARGGHPYPLHIRADGSLTAVRGAGSLLGIPEVPADFEEARLTLRPGEKLLLYSDGLEDVIVAPSDNADEAPVFLEHFRAWVRRPAEEFVQLLRDYLDNRRGSLHPADDATLLVLEVTADA